MSSYPYSNTLSFTDEFLENTKEILSDEDVQRLAVKISANPLEGHKVEEFDDLYYVDWFYFSKNEMVRCRIWYVANKETPHVEVVALTDDTDDTKAASPDELDQAIRDTRKLVKHMRIFHKVVDMIRDIITNPPDFPDVGMF